MTENQFEQMMGMITKSVTSTQKLEREMKETRADIAELKAGQKRLEEGLTEVKEELTEVKEELTEVKDGQNRLERETRANNRAFNEIAGDNLRIKGRVDMLEAELPH